MLSTAGFAGIAALIGDPARATMLALLLDGRALTASELAAAAGITPQTASAHLARLTEAGLLAMERQGRHRYHRLASAAVAQMLESIMAVAAGQVAVAPVRPRTGPRDAAMRLLRSCYDHLAGQVAVALADRLAARGQIELSPDGGALTEAGRGFFAEMGLALPEARGGRLICRPCLDWSERRPHLAGRLGTALCGFCLEQGWMRRVGDSRAITVTPLGWQALHQRFALSPQDF
ncbi:transcriptional regulator [Pseudoroseomonas deserti]|uniref:Transcriptional regulator n=1 Tax=Teichococcus deserti TaxID=1817963 RepID=A0A1V2H699_9PROT|nr:winged helix-turn-helix domain-containing protein [Pseudoroseomonas deserti]ONG56370.1 transcriptional regulator [Pseudoroseomonas deserti]